MKFAALDERYWTLSCGSRYWPTHADAISRVPIPVLALTPSTRGDIIQIDLPNWGADLGVSGKLVSFTGMLSRDGEGLPPWARCDWIGTAFHLLNGTLEREIESNKGPILSYAFRLPDHCHILFDYAWVNRIFMFLRRWAARNESTPEQELFGPLPHAEIRLTHDVDALLITPEIRVKQSVFQVLNAVKHARHAKFSTAWDRLARGLDYLTAKGDLNTLGEVRRLEAEAGLRSDLHFYAGQAGLRRKSLRKILIDPAYDIAAPEMKAELQLFVDGGWRVGLHQSFGAWDDAAPMQREKDRLEQAADCTVICCRQHWLHFSWEKTWKAQAEAGLLFDSTLGFNDRPGFRSSHALTIHPWNRDAERNALPIAITPMVFMDSHFYDYATLTDTSRNGAMRKWLDEIVFVHGTATVNWHTHTITNFYGWMDGYRMLLNLISGIR